MTAELTLRAAIRLSPSDSIGVPLFYLGNSLYVPEMDADFNISAFVDFRDDDGYELSYDIPDEYRQRTFKVGDPAPVIFWYEGRSHLIEGDAEKSKIEQIFGVAARTSPVLLRLGERLNDARTGKIRAQQEEWVATDIEVAFQDVFLGVPTRTKYWVNRYRVALTAAREQTRPPHPIDVRLRRASSEWLRRFATKAEFSLISGVLGEAAQGIYSIDQIRGIVFAYVCSRIIGGSGSDIVKLADNETIDQLFPDGLYRYFLERGWPHVPFEYPKPDFVEVIKKAIFDGRSRRSWKHALRIAGILFGSHDLPNEADDLAMVYLRAVMDGYDKTLKWLDEFVRQRPLAYGDNEHFQNAQQLAELYNRIEELSRIMHGDDRVQGSMLQGRFAINKFDVERHLEFARLDRPLGEY